MVHGTDFADAAAALFVCLLGETALTGVVGAALLCFSEVESVAFAIGLGILAYAGIVLFYTVAFIMALASSDGVILNAVGKLCIIQRNRNF